MLECIECSYGGRGRPVSVVEDVRVCVRVYKNNERLIKIVMLLMNRL